MPHTRTYAEHGGGERLGEPPLVSPGEPAAVEHEQPVHLIAGHGPEHVRGVGDSELGSEQPLLLQRTGERRHALVSVELQLEPQLGDFGVGRARLVDDARDRGTPFASQPHPVCDALGGQRPLELKRHVKPLLADCGLVSSRLEHREQQRALVAESRVQGGKRNAGPFGDLPQRRRRIALPEEQLVGDVDRPLPTQRRLAASARRVVGLSRGVLGHRAIRSNSKSATLNYSI